MTTTTPAPAVFIPGQRATSNPGSVPVLAATAAAGPASPAILVVPDRATPAAPIVPGPRTQATPTVEPLLPRTPAQRRAYAIEVAASGALDAYIAVTTAHITSRTGARMHTTANDSTPTTDDDGTVRTPLDTV